MKPFVIVFIVFISNWILIAFYCRIERRLDRNKFQKLDSGGGQTNAVLPENGRHNSHQSIMKKLYHWLNSYLYGWVRYNILLTAHVPSYRIRKLFYWAVFGLKVTRKTIIFGGCEFRSPWNIVLGNCTIGANCILDGRGRITIENDVVLGSGVHIWTMNHDINDPYFRTLDKNIRQVQIKKYAWIASDSMIQPGVVIGEGVVLASKAVATKDCQPYGLYAGVPAKRIAERNHDLKYKIDGKLTWHFM